MNSDKAISHEGVVIRADGNGVVEVSINPGTACSGCHAKSACGMGTGEEKVITVKTSMNYKPGEGVTVTMDQSQGTRAVIIGYVLPFIVLVAVFVSLTVAKAGELISCLAAFAALGFYYLVIWLLRARIEKRFTFKIKN